VTETALSTALNLAYMAEQLALFGIVVGVVRVLAGVGFMVLALGGSTEPAGSGHSAPTGRGGGVSPRSLAGAREPRADRNLGPRPVRRDG
jgi:hypothetical protein